MNATKNSKIALLYTEKYMHTYVCVAIPVKLFNKYMTQFFVVFRLVLVNKYISRDSGDLFNQILQSFMMDTWEIM